LVIKYFLNTTDTTDTKGTIARVGEGSKIHGSCEKINLKIKVYSE
jgi:hypothetical protein